VPAVSFVLSRMSGCGGPAKSRVTVPKRVWEFVTRERAARLALLAQEARVRILVDGETPELYVLQLCATPPGPPGGAGLCPARKALKALLKETEKELKKRSQRHGEVLGARPEPPAGAAGPPGAGPARDEEPERQCPICLGEMRGPRTLERCRHSFCGECIARALQVRSACPVCGRFYGQLVGNQPPDGRMLVTRDAALPLPGYEAFGTIIIQYVFPPGVQGVSERARGAALGARSVIPNPRGWPWPGPVPPAYPKCPRVLPMPLALCPQGPWVPPSPDKCTRPRSVALAPLGVPTSCWGVALAQFGYPDPTYLARVQEELRAKGITED
ncbi:DTX3 ligase, partial [Gymnorhina tibicen]|nr:DTX3 ligase [Gymnorhina tibicen]